MDPHGRQAQPRAVGSQTVETLAAHTSHTVLGEASTRMRWNLPQRLEEHPLYGMGPMIDGAPCRRNRIFVLAEHAPVDFRLGNSPLFRIHLSAGEPIHVSEVVFHLSDGHLVQ